ncbi:MAG: D-glycero-beta-D-manno-heptose 1,7-bisphosphate 7-phosphatase [Methylococcales bacterium]|nr:D-glycero-beta-D-manno-heptose 1,7-bisphosphate 7-phosphatase [Methylococcales bacterium]
MSANKFILLDRDGVINHDSDHYIKSAEEWLPIAQSIEAIALLNSHGYNVIVITNQSGLARGYFNTTTLQAMHNKMHAMVKQKGGKIEAIYYCPHQPEDHCACRKPKPGLLKQCSEDYNFQLTETFFIGDKLSDVKAAQAVGATPLLVKTGKGQKTLTNNPNLTINFFNNLYDCAQFIISRQ